MIPYSHGIIGSLHILNLSGKRIRDAAFSIQFFIKSLLPLKSITIGS